MGLFSPLYAFFGLFLSTSIHGFLCSSTTCGQCSQKHSWRALLCRGNKLEKPRARPPASSLSNPIGTVRRHACKATPPPSFQRLRVTSPPPPPQPHRPLPQLSAHLNQPAAAERWIALLIGLLLAVCLVCKQKQKHLRRR